MAISRVEVNDYRVFKGEFTADFCSGVNVIIGGNGTGKTTLMRAIYSDFEHDNNREIGLHSYQGRVNVFKSDSEITERIFIPEKDMLSHSRGLLPLWNERNLPYMKYEIDILSKAQMPETRVVKPNAANLIDKIKNIIGGEVVYENDEFFTMKENGEKILFCLEASGFRKFGLLWRLLRNGLLETGSVLMWDEPENSINPELVPVLVDILLELAQNGVQIFIATHDYEVARYFDVRKKRSIPVMFYNFSKSSDGHISCTSSDEYIKVPDNLFESAGKAMFKAVAAFGFGIENDDE